MRAAALPKVRRDRDVWPGTRLKAQTVTCPECGTPMRLTEGRVKALCERVIVARVRLDALTRKAEDQESP